MHESSETRKATFNLPAKLLEDFQALGGKYYGIKGLRQSGRTTEFLTLLMQALVEGRIDLNQLERKNGQI